MATQTDYLSDFGETITSHEKDPLAEFGQTVESGGSDPLAEFGQTVTEPKSASRESFVEDLAHKREAKHWQELSESEIQAIASRNEIDPERVKELSGWWRGIPEGASLGDALKAGLGGSLEAVPFALGTLGREGVAKLTLSDNEVRAMHDVKALLSTRQPYSSKAFDFGASLIAPVGVAAKAATTTEASLAAAKAAQEASGLEKAAKLVAPAAVSGAAEADPGEEGRGAVLGGLVGLGAGAALKVGSSGAAKLGRLLGWGTARQMTDKLHQDDLNAVANKVDAWIEDNVAMGEALASSLGDKETRALIRKDPAKWVAAQSDAVRSQLARASGFTDTDVPEEVVEAGAKTASRILNSLESHLGKDTSREGRSAISDIVAQEAGPETEKQLKYVAQKVGDVLRADHAVELLSHDNELARRTVGTLGETVNRAIASRHVLDEIDERAGTALTPLIDEVSAGLSKANRDVSVAAKLAEPALEKAREAGMGNRELAEALDKGSANHLIGDAKKEAVSLWRKWFEDVRKAANEAGLPVEQLKDEAGRAAGYFPARRLPPIQYSAAVQERAEKLGIQIDNNFKLAEQMKAVVERARADSSSAEAELLRAIEPVGSVIPSAESAARSLREFLDPAAAAARLSAFSRSNIQRSDKGIPDFVRDYDVGRVASGWLSETFKAARTRDAIAKLKLYGETLKEAARRKAEEEGFSRQGDSLVKGGQAMFLYEKGRYVTDLANDLLGGESTSMGKSITYGLSKWALKAEKAANQLAREAESAAANGQWVRSKALKMESEMTRSLTNPTEVLSDLSSNLYTNYLGGDPNKAFRNAVQVFVKTVPAMGGRYGMLTFARAAKEMAADWRAGRKAIVESGDRGLLNSDVSREALVNLQDGLTKAGVPRQMHRFMSKWLLFGYQAADVANRAVTAKMGDVLTRDVAEATAKIKAGEKLSWTQTHAVALFRSMPAGIRSEASRAMLKGDVDASSAVVSRWLEGFTQLNYDKAAMSRLGRWGGPLISMFSTWPSSMAGEVKKVFHTTGDEVLDRFRRGRAIMSVFGPLVGLAAMDKVADVWNPFDFRDKQEKSEPSWGRLAMRTMFGGKEGGLTSAAPVQALKSFTHGVGSPPVLSGALKTAEKGLSGDVGGVAEAIGETTVSLLPFGTRAIHNMYRDWVPEIPLAPFSERPYVKPSELINESLGLE
jgi:hypothetical protein